MNFFYEECDRFFWSRKVREKADTSGQCIDFCVMVSLIHTIILEELDRLTKIKDYSRQRDS